MHMNREDWQKQYREQCYLPILKEYIEETIQNLTKHAEEINKKLNEQVDAFFCNLELLQKKGKLGEVQTICISFPYTSLSCGEPYFLFEVYPDMPFLDDSIVFREFPADWLFIDWEQFLEKLQKEVGNQGMNQFIRKPYIKSQAWESARTILYLVSNFVKYYLYKLEEMDSYRRLKKADGFMISFGEYMDWQQIIWIEKKEVDIFLCEKDTNLCFCQFQKAWYDKKAFKMLVLDDCKFQECTFINCQFSGCSFKDTKFIGCTFQGCSFSDIDFAGASFDGCKLEDIQMEKIRTYCFSEEIESLPVMRGMAEFLGCFLISVTIKDSDFSASYFYNCQMEEIHTQECQMSESLLDVIAGGKKITQ